MAVDSARSLQYEYKAVSQMWWALFGVRMFNKRQPFIINVRQTNPLYEHHFNG